MFRDTYGSVAWLCHCAKVTSTLHVMEKCYDKKPNFYENWELAVDPIIRQTFVFANQISGEHATQKLFQLDMAND